MTSGNSGLPLVKKLTLRDGMRVWFDAMPETVIDEIDEYALELRFVADPGRGIDAAHIFVTERKALEAHLAALRNQIALDGQIWVSWPKQASAEPTDITEDIIREVCLPLGLVDTKACDIDDDWAGLKLVIRKELR
ncbi:MAG TPA: DUF3052 family protein [Erythrobacter sp.]|nr:DUF3052 family protein [Erythrobacter sp.]